MISRAKENPFERRTLKHLGHGNQTNQKGRQFLDTVQNLNTNLFLFKEFITRAYLNNMLSLFFILIKGYIQQIYKIQFFIN
jgi:hypothetical protein